MWYPGQGLNQELKKMFLAALADTEIKAEISRQIRVEMDNQRNKYHGTVQSYESLTAGNVNMQARMAASGYDVYGNTIIGSNKNTSNVNTYKKMKNKIKYGKAPQSPKENRGNTNIF
jgi:hypothetical protein